jgi:hypothetical protein
MSLKGVGKSLVMVEVVLSTNIGEEMHFKCLGCGCALLARDHLEISLPEFSLAETEGGATSPLVSPFASPRFLQSMDLRRRFL